MTTNNGHVLGALEIGKEGDGFLRRPVTLLPSPEDVLVSAGHIRNFGLRPGDMLTGQSCPSKTKGQLGNLLPDKVLQIESVSGLEPEAARQRPVFEEMTPVHPCQHYRLETRRDVLVTRMLDMLAPIGRGQRGLIVSPPKAGKTSILKQIAGGIKTNYPDVHTMIVLIGERPEEVTEMVESAQAEVVSATFDAPEADQVRVTEMALARGKRLVEGGRDVVILIDSLTRLARAYNLVIPPSGRTLSGGIDPAALHPPKQLFGAARKLREGGSLTIIATSLVETGSRMDDVIYEEFKGTGNMEMHLSRKLAQRRFFPAIDIERSSTRREDLLLPPAELAKVWVLRRMITAVGGGPEATEMLLERLRKTDDNKEFLATLHQV